jgi:ribose/xylose/arabinose/galactoside ABC-type transport system permease subunit
MTGRRRIPVPLQALEEPPPGSHAAHSLRIRSVATKLAELPPSIPAVVLVLLIALVAVPDFFAPTNLIGLAPQVAALAVLTIGQTLTLLVRGLDLSVSAMVGTAAVILSGAIFGPIAERVAIVIAVSLGLGLVNGFLITKRRVPAFIATFGTLVFLGGARLGVTQGQTSGTAPDWMVTIGVGRLGLLPWSVIIAALVFAVFAVVLNWTRFGRWIYAVGSNSEAARYSGIAVDRVTIACYIACALLAALAGVMMGGFAGYIDYSLGVDANLNSIAAAIIGGVAFTGGRGSLAGALAGVIVMSVILNLILLSGFDIQWRYVMQGLILIAAVALPRFYRRV